MCLATSFALQTMNIIYISQVEARNVAFTSARRKKQGSDTWKFVVSKKRTRRWTSSKETLLSTDIMECWDCYKNSENAIQASQSTQQIKTRDTHKRKKIMENLLWRRKRHRQTNLSGRVSNQQLEGTTRNLSHRKRTIGTNNNMRKRQRSNLTYVPVNVRDSIRKTGKDLKNDRWYKRAQMSLSWNFCLIWDPVEGIYYFFTFFFILH